MPKHLLALPWSLAVCQAFHRPKCSCHWSCGIISYLSGNVRSYTWLCSFTACLQPLSVPCPVSSNNCPPSSPTLLQTAASKQHLQHPGWKWKWNHFHRRVKGFIQAQAWDIIQGFCLLISLYLPAVFLINTIFLCFSLKSEEKCPSPLYPPPKGKERQAWCENSKILWYCLLILPLATSASM